MFHLRSMIAGNFKRQFAHLSAHSKSWFYLTLALFFTLSFNACNQNYGLGQGSPSSENPGITGSGDPSPLVGDDLVVDPVTGNPSSDQNNNGVPDRTEVMVACQNSPHVKKTQTIVFEKPAETCKWGVDGNLMQKNEFFQARIEQLAKLEVPIGAKLCDVGFSFQPQPFLYDDHFIMTYDHAIMASSYDFTSKFAKLDSMMIYDWQKMVGMVWDMKKETVFCQGADRGQASCSWPDTDIAGVINMSYKSEVIQAASAVNILVKDHFFRFIAIGDDNEFDCEHSRIQFDVNLDYVQ